MNSLIPYNPLPPGFASAVSMWADTSTDAASSRRRDLIREKTNALLSDGKTGTAAGFFVFCPKSPVVVTPSDVQAWRIYLEEIGLSAASIYGRVSKLSSFYRWLKTQPEFGDSIGNPVPLARPKAPKPYQNTSSQSLTDKQVKKLMAYVREQVIAGQRCAARDYALLKFYFATGKRREEIIQLRWGDLTIEGATIVITTKDKGGIYTGSEIEDESVYGALLNYLYASGRHPDYMLPEYPLWLRHDSNATYNEPLNSRGFVNMLKKYAKGAGIGDIHLHQTRHTVARWAGEELGSLTDVQTVLGHSNPQTTRVYLQRVGVKRDKISKKIADRLREE